MTKSEPIAIVGSGCRFPGGASSPARLWELLREPRDLSARPPRSRFNMDSFYHENCRHPGTTNACNGYFLDEPMDRFDAPFFNISKAEADSIDPQQRLLLETVYEAFETAGCRLEDLQGSSTGIFCGVMCDDYRSIVFRDLDALPQYAATGTSAALLSNRISYFFNLRGPSMTIDTACSSSLVAVHTAARALQTGDCNIAIAAGTNLILAPNVYLSESNLSMLSPTGRSRMWDANADGYARGEGVAAVVLKRLSDAIHDGDDVECVIRASNVNQYGRTLGITMPSPQAQKELILKTYADAGLDPINRPEDRCQYFEAHGTGTPAGDPQEARAVHDAFFAANHSSGKSGDVLYVGSIKTVIGHTEGTAGLAGLLKASMSVQNAIIPPNLHFESLNPDILPYTDSLRVPTETIEWPTLPPGSPRRASVNSFGFGGTNAHVIVESYDRASALLKPSQAVLPFVFSAPSDRALGELLYRHSVFLDPNVAVNLNNLAWTLLKGRSSFNHRLVLCASSTEELKGRIEAEIQSRQSGTPSTIFSRPAQGRKRILGIFTGQGAQWARMGIGLLQMCPDARGWMQELQCSLDELPEEYRSSDFSLMETLSEGAETSRVNEAKVSQPLCTAVQIILTKVLRALGVELTAVVGHSSGEIAAAYAAGYLTAHDAIRIAYFRGFFSRLARSDNGHPGAMAAAGLSHEEAECLCNKAPWVGRVTVAAYNSPGVVTLSGDADAITELCSLLQQEGKFCRALKVDTAYHSHHMLSCSSEYIKALEVCEIAPTAGHTSTTWFSSVYDGREIGDDDRASLCAEYWNQNLVSPVRFNQAVVAGTQDTAFDLAVEIGPHPALKGPFQQSVSQPEPPYTGLLKRGSDDIQSVAAMIGTCWTYLGADSVDLNKYTRLYSPDHEPRPVKNLPSYPFDHREAYWATSRATKSIMHRSDAPDPLLGNQSPEAGEGEWRWRNYLHRDDIPWLGGQRMLSQIVFPVSIYIALLWQAAKILATKGSRRLRSIEIYDMEIAHTIVLEDEMSSLETLFKIDLTADDDMLTESIFTCYANIRGVLQRCVSGKAVLHKGEPDSDLLPRCSFASSGIELGDAAQIYSKLAGMGYGLSGQFKAISSVERNQSHSRGILKASASHLEFHPSMLEGLVQAILITADEHVMGPLTVPFVPSKIKRIAINPTFLNARILDTSLHFEAFLGKTTKHDVIGDGDIFTEDGQGIMQVEGMELVPFIEPREDDRTFFSEITWGPLNPTVSPDLALQLRDKATLQKHLIEAAHQICFRYPHMNILEIGSRACPPITHLRHSCQSYTYTQDSTGSLDQIKGLDQIRCEGFNVARGPLEQGYTEHAYDLLLVPEGLDSRITLDQTFKNLRKLLKPGGYLLMVQETDSEVEREAVLPTDTWDAILQSAGFSAIDTVVPARDTLLPAYSVFIYQGVDDTIQMLQDPLAAVDVASTENELYIIGDGLSMAADLEPILKRHFQSVIRIPRLEQFSPSNPAGAKVLFLRDLDTTHDDVDEAQYQALQQLVQRSDSILWVTRRKSSDIWNQDPLTAALHKTSAECSSIRLQCLDVAREEEVSAQTLATALLRLTNCSLENDHKLPTHVWSMEPSLRLQDGVFQIPRLRHSTSMNHRLMADQHTTYEDCELSESNVRVNSTSDHCHFEVQPDLVLSPDQVQIKVMYSSTSAIRIDDMFLYVVVGKIENTEATVLALSAECASVISVSSSWVLPLEYTTQDGPQALRAFMLSLMAIAATGLARPNTTMLVHEAGNTLRRLLAAHTLKNQVSPVFTTSQVTADQDCRFIHPMSPNRVVTKFLDNNVSAILICDENPGIFSRTNLTLPRGVVPTNTRAFFNSHSQSGRGDHSISAIAEHLKMAQSLMDLTEGCQGQEPFVVPVQSILNKTEADTMAILDWTKPGFVPVMVKKASSNLRLSPESAYLLVNLDRDVAKLAIDLLVSKGAGKIIVAGSYSDVDAEWEEFICQTGARVEFMSIDFTDRESVMSMKNTTAESWGHIGGILGGNIDIYAATLLNDMFSDHKMEFFTFFKSSLGLPCSFGRLSVSEADAFLMEMTYQRRDQGLPASVIHSDPVGGVSMASDDLSELLAEGIFAGRVDSWCSPIVIAGVCIETPKDKSNMLLYQNPVLWSMVRDSVRSNEVQILSQELCLKDQLALVLSDINQLEAKIQVAFIAKIQKTLRLAHDQGLNSQSTLLELGVDSLVATSLRSWFMNEAGVDMPIMKLLNNASIGSLVEYAAKDLYDHALAKGSESSRPSSPDDESTDATSVSDELPLVDGKYTRVEQLSYAQSRYWFLHQYYEDRTAFNVTLLFNMDRQPQVDDLKGAVTIVTQRHQSLRTCYVSGGDEGKTASQAILPICPTSLEVSTIEDESELMDEYARVRDHLYDTEQGECVRFRLVLVTASDAALLIIGYPHMCMDGASLFVLLDDLDLAYRRMPLPPVGRQYPDFSAAQRAAYEQGGLKRELDYWRTELTPLPEPVPLLPMTKVRSRPPLREYDTEEIEVSISTTIMDRIRLKCRQQHVTPFHFFMAVLRILIVRLTKTDDLCIGVADSNRLDPANEHTVGFLLNLLPLRFRQLGDDFKGILVETRDKCYGGLNHSAMPFDKLLDELAVSRSNTHSPLFQILMDWQPRLGGEVKLGDTTSVCKQMAVGRTVYDLTLLITESAQRDATVHFRLQKALYSKEGAEVLVRSYIHLLETFSNDLDVQPSTQCVWHPSDLNRALEVGQGPSYASQWPSTVSRRIEKIADSQKEDALAVTDTKGRSLTYRTLMDRVHTLASTLQSVGVTSGSLVCVFQHPTADWVCCMLAIWRLNAVYVPLDLRNPLPRLATVVNDCQPKSILCSDETWNDVDGLDCPGAAVVNTSEVDSCNCENVQPSFVEDSSVPDAPAAVLYTSGSTGTPKGILLRHSGIRNQVEGYTRRWGLGPEVVLQQGAMTFNHSLDQILTGLCTGGRVVVVTRDLRGDPVSLTKLVVDEDITYTKATPAEYSMWLQYGSASLSAASSWRHAFGGGEHFTTTLSQGFKSLDLPNLSLYNSYGPGEITISSHKMKIDYKNPQPAQEDIFPVGFSLPNYATYVVDDTMQPVPPGVSGEIIIGGSGPCLGYLDRESLTAEKFIDNPFATREFIKYGWTKAYRTFDRGRLLSDGSLVIEGRLDGDTQVKIRGIRIELEDIENSIVHASEGNLVNAIVSLHGENQMLAAHVVFASDSQAAGERDSFLQRLKASLPLPQYMCPSIFVPVDNLPLTIHGKVDRKAIRSMPLPRTTASNEGLEELSGTEAVLRDLWEQVLEGCTPDITSAGRDADFFLVGGNSVLSVKLQSVIRQTLGVSVSLIDLFAASTLKDMAAVVQAAVPDIAIDWNEETSLPEIATTTNSPAPVRTTEQGIVVVLTGATGFLGHTVLQQLLDNPTVAHVYAVAVRPEGRGIGRPLPSASPKFTALAGDVSHPLFGLDPDTFEILATQADFVIHSAASRAFWDAYPIIRGSNVTGTRNAIALASHRKIPIHFLSSGAVDKVVEANNVPPIDGRNGFLASKWASETMLAAAAAELNIPVTVHRLTQIADSKPPPADIISAFAEIAQQIRCVPTVRGWGRLISLQPLVELATSVVSWAMSSVTQQQLSSSMTVQHHTIPNTFELSDAAEAIQKILPVSDELDSLHMLYWLGKAKREAKFPWFVAAQDVIVNSEGETVRVQLDG